jgi:hypothetical protein
MAARMLGNILQFVQSMQLKVQPELHYGDLKHLLLVPKNFPISDELLFEVELFHFCKAKVLIALCIDRIFCFFTIVPC